MLFWKNRRKNLCFVKHYKMQKNAGKTARMAKNGKNLAQPRHPGRTKERKKAARPLVK